MSFNFHNVSLTSKNISLKLLIIIQRLRWREKGTNSVMDFIFNHYSSCSVAFCLSCPIPKFLFNFPDNPGLFSTKNIRWEHQSQCDTDYRSSVFQETLIVTKMGISIIFQIAVSFAWLRPPSSLENIKLGKRGKKEVKEREKLPRQGGSLLWMPWEQHPNRGFYIANYSLISSCLFFLIIIKRGGEKEEWILKRKNKFKNK